MVANLVALANSGIAYALALIVERYEKAKPALPFHVTGHTLQVVDRTQRLSQAMGLPMEEQCCCCLAAAFHDTVWKWRLEVMPDGAIIRKALSGYNERASAQDLDLWASAKGSFSAYHISLMKEAVVATITVWDWGNASIIQPHLYYQSHPVVRCVALADLGTAGMDALAFVNEGNGRFREKNVDIDQAIAQAQAKSDVSQSQQDWYCERMLEWSERQIAFAIGRKKRFDSELGNLEGSARQNVTLLFSNFDQSIKLVHQAFKDRQAMGFWPMAEAMGYRVPTS